MINFFNPANPPRLPGPLPGERLGGNEGKAWENRGEIRDREREKQGVICLREREGCWVWTRDIFKYSQKYRRINSEKYSRRYSTAENRAGCTAKTTAGNTKRRRKYVFREDRS